jgi:hypothetical protein
MTKEIAEDINAYAPVDGLDGEGMPGNMSSQAYIEIQFFSYPVGYFGHIYLIVGEQPGSLFLPALADKNAWRLQAEFFKLAVEMHAAYTHVRAKGGAGWNQGELAQLQLGLLTLTAFLLTSAQNMSR